MGTVNSDLVNCITKGFDNNLLLGISTDYNGNIQAWYLINADTCGLSIAPNPAGNIVYAEVASGYVQEGNVITVYDGNGKKLDEFDIVPSNGHITLNVAHYVKGNYYLALRNGEEILCSKMLIVE